MYRGNIEFRRYSSGLAATSAYVQYELIANYEVKRATFSELTLIAHFKVKRITMLPLTRLFLKSLSELYIIKRKGAVSYFSVSHTSKNSWPENDGRAGVKKKKKKNVHTEHERKHHHLALECSRMIIHACCTWLVTVSIM